MTTHSHTIGDKNSSQPAVKSVLNLIRKVASWEVCYRTFHTVSALASAGVAFDQLAKGQPVQALFAAVTAGAFVFLDRITHSAFSQQRAERAAPKSQPQALHS